jgi:pimeloyl-ACP methyl ester carboxylesterase
MQGTPYQRVELRLDITGEVALGGKVEIAATAYLPQAQALGPCPVAMFAFPGGGYSRGYYDLHFAGHEGYSEAEFHARRGTVFIAFDHLGVGESTLGPLDSMRIEDIAQANDAAVRIVAARLAEGTLAGGYPAVPQFFRVGTGQSMGGGLTIIMQGRHRTYQAIAPLGYSAIHTVLPQRSAAAREAAVQGRGHGAGRLADPSSLSLAESSRSIEDFIYPFHAEDVPRDILEADMAGGYPIRRHPPPWGSATIPNCVIAMMSPGFVSAEAAAIDVPVFMGLGERDVSPDPHAEPSAFRGTGDVSLFVVPRMAHMHNFASTRRRMWQRLHDWSRAVASQ